MGPALAQCVPQYALPLDLIKNIEHAVPAACPNMNKEEAGSCETWNVTLVANEYRHISNEEVSFLCNMLSPSLVALITGNDELQ